MIRLPRWIPGSLAAIVAGSWLASPPVAAQTKAKPATATASSQPAQAPQKVASVEGITEYRLDNGLRVLLFPDPSKSTVTVNITYLVGSRHEGYGETGMAHLLEHMLFKGSPQHPNIPQELHRTTARAPNGTTWYDRTNYFETLRRHATRTSSGRSTSRPTAWSTASSPPEDLQVRVLVVRNEFEIGENSPQGVLIERILATAYLWHNYGKSTIGSRADIETVPVPTAAGVLREVLPAGQRGADRGRQVRRGQDAGADRREVRRDPAARRACSSRPTPSSRRRTASARSSCAASATSTSSPPATTCRPPRTSTSRRSKCFRSSSPTRRPGGSTRRWSRPRRPPRSSAGRRTTRSRPSSCSAPRCARRSRSRTHATPCSPRSKNFRPRLQPPIARSNGRGTRCSSSGRRRCATRSAPRSSFRSGWAAATGG